MATATQIFYVRVEVTAENQETLRRHITWAKRNIAQVTENMGDAHISIAVYNKDGLQESYTVRNTVPVPPLTLEEELQ